jgi:hypothetical protein
VASASQIRRGVPGVLIPGDSEAGREPTPEKVSPVCKFRGIRTNYAQILAEIPTNVSFLFVFYSADHQFSFADCSDLCWGTSHEQHNHRLLTTQPLL